MKLTICEFAGNFVCGATSDAISGIDLDESIQKYCETVENSITALGADITVEWDIRNGEGDPSPYFHAEPVDPEDRSGLWDGYEEEIKFGVDAIREKVFSEGNFWVNAK